MKSIFSLKTPHIGLMSSFSVLCLCGSMQIVTAEEKDHKEGFESHGAHEHGAARMTIALTKTGLDVSLESPSVNVFGFEHNAGSDDEHKVVHNAVKTLKADDKIITANSEAECKLTDVKIDSTIVAAHKAEKHSEEGHDHDKEDDHKEHDDHEKKDDHEKHDDHDKHDDHKKHDDHDKKDDHDKHDDHDHEKHDESTHSDVDVNWSINCEHPEKLSSANIRLFSAFPKGFEELDVEWVSEKSAGSVEIKKDQVVSFKP